MFIFILVWAILWCSSWQNLNLDLPHLKLKDPVQLFVHKYETIIAGSTFIPVSLCNHGDTAPQLEKLHRTCVYEKASCCNSESAERRGWKHNVLKPQNTQCLFDAFSFGLTYINNSSQSYLDEFFTPIENQMSVSVIQGFIPYNFIYFIIISRM